MEIILKNTTNKFQKCTLFGNYDRALKNKRSENDFFDFTTGKGVEIYFDGDLSELKRLYFLKHIYNDTFYFSHIEYTDCTNQLNSMFHICITDANGKSMITEIIPVIPQMYMTPQQETAYPLKITSEYTNIDYINILTCFLFLLRPKQEIKLNFVEATVSKTEKVNH